MAFQCEGCYADKSEFMYASLSRGPCENCGYTDVCVDRPFNIDPNWKQNLVKDLIRANLPIPDEFAQFKPQS